MCTRVVPRGAWLAACALLVPRFAHAQAEAVEPPRPVVVVVDDSAASVTPPAATREAIERELHAPVLAPGETAAVTSRGTLTLAVDAEHRLVIAYRDAEGHEVFRAIAVPGDPVAAVATVALIAGNLARNDADALLAAMRPAVTPPPVQPLAPPPPVVLGPAPRIVLIDPAENRAMAHPLSLGVEGYISGVSIDTQTATALGASGLMASYAFASHFAIGVDNVSFATASIPGGSRLGLAAGPFAEVFGFLMPWCQLYAQGGVPIQRRWGAGLPASTGIAPFVGGGVRFWIGDRITIGVGVRGFAVATDGYLFSDRVLPQGALILSGGAELAVHL